MRITNSMVINSFLNNVGTAAGNVNKYQTQVQTGKLYQYASDSPIAAAKSIRYKSKIDQLEQNEKNIEDAKELLKVTETALDSYNDVLQRISELSVEAVNGTKGDEDRAAINVELEQLKNEIVDIANTKYNGRYIFSGYKTDQKLLNDDGTYNVDVQTTGDAKEDISYSIGFGSTIQVNTLGPDVFGDSSSDGGMSGIIGDLDELIASIKVGNTSDIKTAGGKIENRLQVCLDELADVGARVNRVELTENRVKTSLTNLEESLSINDDADYAESITNLANSKSIYQAALSAGSKTLQMSLMDYI